MAHYRSIFISDLHLGSKGAQADKVLAFLNQNTCERLYLVGDVIDFWALSRKSYFPKSHRDVLCRLREIAASGTEVTYVVGNHDEALRSFLPMDLNGIRFTNETRHACARTGKVYLVIHGDQFDDVMENMRWLAYVGDIAYTLALRLNRYVNAVRYHLNLKPWSISAYLKHRVKSAVNFISSFEEALANAAQTRNCDGVICGHIHTAEDRMFGTTHYLNTGDWVESCTALVENADGSLRIVQCADLRPANEDIVLPSRKAA